MSSVDHPISDTTNAGARQCFLSAIFETHAIMLNEHEAREIATRPTFTSRSGVGQYPPAGSSNLLRQSFDDIPDQSPVSGLLRCDCKARPRLSQWRLEVKNGKCCSSHRTE